MHVVINDRILNGRCSWPKDDLEQKVGHNDHYPEHPIQNPDFERYGFDFEFFFFPQFHNHQIHCKILRFNSNQKGISWAYGSEW